MQIQPNSNFVSEIAECIPDDLVILIGSGISKTLPSGLPLGSELRAKILFSLQDLDIFNSLPELLKSNMKKALEGCPSSSSSDDGLETNGLPFEGLLEIYEELFPNTRDVQNFLNHNLHSTDNNCIHYFIASCLLHKPPIISALITTNYDTLIETSLISSRWEQVKVYKEEQYESRIKDSPIYLKIHGTLENMESVIATLSAERGLAPWKKRCLHDLIRNKVVLILGYSGLDFDVCPEIMLAHPKKVYWNTRTVKPLSQDAYDVLNSCQGIHMYGDVVEFIKRLHSELLKKIPDFISSITKFELLENTKEKDYRKVDTNMFKKDNCAFWLIQSSIEIGSGTIALDLLEKLESEPNLISQNLLLILRTKARATFLQEKYRASERWYLRAIQKCHDKMIKADLLISYFEACRLQTLPHGGRGVYLPRPSSLPSLFLQSVIGIRKITRAWLVAFILLGFQKETKQNYRSRGYLWLRIAQIMDNFYQLLRKTPILSKTVLFFRFLGLWCLKRADRYFGMSDNYFGTQYTQRIRLRLTTVSIQQKLEQLEQLKDHYRRLGFLTGWSNSNRDIINTMLEIQDLSSLQLDDMYKLAQEALQISTLVDERPGIRKARELIKHLDEVSTRFPMQRTDME